MISDSDKLRFSMIKKRIAQRRYASAFSFIMTGVAFALMILSVATSVELWTVILTLVFIFLSPFVLKDSWRQYGLEREVGAIEGAIDMSKEMNSMKVIELMSECFNDKDALTLIHIAREERIRDGMKFLFGGRS